MITKIIFPVPNIVIPVGKNHPASAIGFPLAPLTFIEWPIFPNLGPITTSFAMQKAPLIQGAVREFVDPDEVGIHIVNFKRSQLI